MLQFTYKLKLTERVKGKCNRHPRYNPEKDGRAGIRDGCSCCFSLFDLHQARVALDAAQREFIRRAVPWTRPRESRQKKAMNAIQKPPSDLPDRIPIEHFSFNFGNTSPWVSIKWLFQGRR